jgi:methylated-DNA-[protein]-cysteine S-methyltransferase
VFEQAIKTGRLKTGMTFSQKVWALTARIPSGRICTYAQLAHALDCRGYRAVGQALNRNPYAPVVPCHRVVGSDGRLTGFATGLKRKTQLLQSEGIPIRNGRVDLNSRLFSFASTARRGH